MIVHTSRGTPPQSIAVLISRDIRCNRLTKLYPQDFVWQKVDFHLLMAVRLKISRTFHAVERDGTRTHVYNNLHRNNLVIKNRHEILIVILPSGVVVVAAAYRQGFEQG